MENMKTAHSHGGAMTASTPNNDWYPDSPHTTVILLRDFCRKLNHETERIPTNEKQNQSPEKRDFLDPAALDPATPDWCWTYRHRHGHHRERLEPCNSVT